MFRALLLLLHSQVNVTRDPADAAGGAAVAIKGHGQLAFVAVVVDGDLLTGGDIPPGVQAAPQKKAIGITAMIEKPIWRSVRRLNVQVTAKLKRRLTTSLNRLSLEITNKVPGRERHARQHRPPPRRLLAAHFDFGLP